MSQPYEIPLFPLNTVLFPGMVLPLHIFEERYMLMIRRCLAEAQPFGVVLLKSGRPEGAFGDFHAVGTLAQITQTAQLAGDRMNIVTVGQKRFRILETYHEHPYLTGIVEDYPLEGIGTPRTIHDADRISHELEAYLKRFKELGKINADFRELPDDPEILAFLTAIFLPVADEIKQELLSISEASDMLEREYDLLRHEATILSILADERPVQQDSTIAFSLN